MINPRLPIIARAHSDEEIAHLKRHGASKVIMGEHLIAHAMIVDAREAGALVLPAGAPVDQPPAPQPAGACRCRMTRRSSPRSSPASCSPSSSARRAPAPGISPLVGYLLAGV